MGINQADEVVAIFEYEGFMKTTVIMDLSGIERVIIAES